MTVQEVAREACRRLGMKPRETGLVLECVHNASLNILAAGIGRGALNVIGLR